MNRRCINEIAFWMACEALGTLDGLGEEEVRRLFAERFETCRAGLEAYCLQEERKQNNLRPLEERHHVRSKAV